MEYFQNLLDLLDPKPTFTITDNFLTIHSDTSVSIINSVLKQLELSFIMFKSNIEIFEILLKSKKYIKFDILTRQPIINDNKKIINIDESTKYGITIQGALKPLFALAFLQKKHVVDFHSKSLRKRFFPEIEMHSCLFIGTLNNEFILLEISSDIYVVDQHGLHERILYERIKNKSKACRGAVKFGDVLEYNFVVYLINEMLRCKHPFICAHGRPIIHKLTSNDFI